MAFEDQVEEAGVKTLCQGLACLGAAVIFGVSNTATADVIDDAYRLCSAIEGTNLATECKVSGWGSTVDTTIDTTSAEARKICAGIADMMAQKTHTFAGKWKLRIFSPYSGEHPIASCILR